MLQINKRSMDEYFGLETLKVIVRQPLTATETADKFDVIVNVRGGGYTGQAGAIRHGIARALLQADAELQTCSEEGWLPDPRSSYEGTQEVRPQSRSSRSAVQQAIIYSLIMLKKPGNTPFSGLFLCLKSPDSDGEI